MNDTVEGVTITYQGKTCLPYPFEYSRDVGLSPGRGVVHMHRADFEVFQIKESLVGVDLLPSLQTREKVAAKGFLSAGTLVFSETVNGVTKEVVWEQVLVTEDAIESAFDFDDDSDVVRIQLTDIRYLWDRRGVVFSWINVPRQGSEASESQRTQGSQGGLLGLGTFSTALVEARSNPKLTPPTIGMLDGSQNNGKPWTLRRVLEEKVLPALPGSPVLREIEKDVAALIPVGHTWVAKLPRDCLADLLEEFRLEVALNHDASVSIWRKGKGGLHKREGSALKPVAYGFKGNDRVAEIDGDVAESRRLVKFGCPPSCVVVVGPPKIKTARLALEAVGEIRSEGGENSDARKGAIIVPLRQALAAIGVNSESVARAAVLRSPGERALMLGIGNDKLSEFDRWAYKWYRIPGGAKEHGDKLPILKASGSVGHAGELLPPSVFSEGHRFATTAAIVRALSSLGGGSNKSDKVFNAILAAKHHKVGYNVEFTLQATGYEIDERHGIVKFDAPQGKLEATGSYQDSSKLAEQARVELEFAYVKKPRIQDQISELDYYTAVFTKDAGGNVVQTPLLPTGAAPLVIHRPDLQIVEGADGKDNRAELDSVSRNLAANVFMVPAATVGAVVTLCRPVPIVNTGQVLSVTHATDAQERPVVTVHVGAFAPLAPNPRPTTREKPRQLPDSVYVSKGLTR